MAEGNKFGSAHSWQLAKVGHFITKPLATRPRMTSSTGDGKES